MDAFLVSFGIIFVAELGDKSQLMALAFAARYRPLPILVGIAQAPDGSLVVTDDSKGRIWRISYTGRR